MMEPLNKWKVHFLSRWKKTINVVYVKRDAVSCLSTCTFKTDKRKLPDSLWADPHDCLVYGRTTEFTLKGG